MMNAGDRWVAKTRKRLQLPMETNEIEVWNADVRNRWREDRDALILGTGDRRSGKSTTARKLARRQDPTFNIQDRVWFDIVDVIAAAEEMEPGQAIIWDEMIEGGMGREAMTRLNRDMTKFFTISGEKKLIVYCLIPHIDVADSILRNFYATDWVLKESRPFGKLHVRAPGGDYPGKKKHWTDICRFTATKDREAEDEVYKAKKAGARQLIGKTGPVDAAADKARVAAWTKEVQSFIATGK